MDKYLKLTKKVITDLPSPPPGKRGVYFDTQVQGLLVRITSNGKKAFYVRRKHEGVGQRLKIGNFPETQLEEARKRALELCAALSRGDNPRRKKIEIKANRSLGELLETYLSEYAREQCAAAKEIEAVYRRYLSDWQERKLPSITKAEVQRKLNQIMRHHGKIAANHTLTYAKAAINWCIKNQLIPGENPFAGVKKFKVQARERFLKPEELKKFFECLRNLPNDSGIRDYIYLSLFTGARQANVLAMRWEQIDFDLGLWTIPRTKGGDSHTLPLTSAALEILTTRYKNALTKTKKLESEWVFPGKGKTEHLVEPKKGWQALLEATEIENLRMHDLRRTLGSYMAMGNQSLHIIGKVLGHKSPTATQIYSRLTYDPIRQAMEKAQNDMLTDSGGASCHRSGRNGEWRAKKCAPVTTTTMIRLLALIHQNWWVNRQKRGLSIKVGG